MRVSSLHAIEYSRPIFETDIQELGSGNYTLDPDHATLLFKINHLGFSSFIGRFNDFDAALDFDPENIGNSTLEVIVDAASIDVNNPEFAEELRGASWFNTEAFPQAVFRTTSLLEGQRQQLYLSRRPHTVGHNGTRTDRNRFPRRWQKFPDA